MKKSIRELMLFNSITPVNSCMDLLALLQGHTSVLLTTFSKADIAREREKLPAKMKSLKGALEIHLLRFTSEGQVEAKKLPTDLCYSKVNIGTTSVGLGVSMMADRLAVPDVEVHHEE